MTAPLQLASSSGDSGRSAADEAALAARVRLGDEGAFEQLFRAYHRSLRDFVAGYLGSSDAADEVVQDVFARIWTRRAEWRLTDTVRSYLYGAARNRALDVLKHRRVTQRWATSALRGSVPGMGEGPPAADARVRTQQLIVAVDRVVAALPERCRLAWTLRRRHGLTDAEAARVMGISVKGVEYQMARALEALREELREFF